MSIDEKIRGILEDCMKECLDMGIKIGFRGENHRSDVAPIRNRYLSQIKSIIKEELPEECYPDKLVGMAKVMKETCEGWNSYHDELVKRWGL